MTPSPFLLAWLALTIATAVVHARDVGRITAADAMWFPLQAPFLPLRMLVWLDWKLSNRVIWRRKTISTAQGEDRHAKEDA